MTIKRCTSCNKLKHFIQFSRGNDPLSLHYWCKECEKVYRFKNRIKMQIKKKLYRSKNKDKMLQYRIDNKEHIKKQRKQYSKNYYKDNREEVQKKTKKYYKDNRITMNKKQGIYYEKNKELFSVKTKEYNRRSAVYISFFNKLTVDECPRVSKDEVSLEVKCRYCGKYFIPTNNEVARRIRALNGTATGENSLYCSNNCKKACPIFGQQKWPKGFKRASSREVNPLIRQISFERDNWKCQICGKSTNEVSLHCHHIEGVAQNPRLSNDVKNTVTLCKYCHKEVHKLPGCNYYELRCDTKE